MNLFVECQFFNLNRISDLNFMKQVLMSNIGEVQRVDTILWALKFSNYYSKSGTIESIFLENLSRIKLACLTT